MAQETHPASAHEPPAVVETDSEGYPPEPGGSHHDHPNESFYIKIALVLFLITAAEVAVYYVGVRGMALVAILFAMAAVKFSLVAMFFMHLRFDSPIFRRLFVVGIVLAITIYTIVLTTLHVWD